jgi:hypothetical protein
MGVLLVALIVGASSFAVAGVPDLGLSVATMATSGVTLSLFNLPNGGGQAFTEATDASGATQDATIGVVLKDGLGAYVKNYPREDVTLSCAEAKGNAMVPCIGGATADAETNDVGYTQFQTPLAAGGFADAVTEVLIAGHALTSGTVALRMNSADMDGDGTVNLTDISAFSSVFYGAYDYSADFNGDGVINLVDISSMASGVGGSCP